MDGQYSTVGGAVAMNAKRGYVPEDDRNFSPEAVSTLIVGTELLTQF